MKARDHIEQAMASANRGEMMLAILALVPAARAIDEWLSKLAVRVTSLEALRAEIKIEIDQAAAQRAYVELNDTGTDARMNLREEMPDPSIRARWRGVPGVQRVTTIEDLASDYAEIWSLAPDLVRLAFGKAATIGARAHHAKLANDADVNSEHQRNWFAERCP